MAATFATQRPKWHNFCLVCISNRLCKSKSRLEHLCTSCFKPKHACAVKPEVLISWTPELSVLALTKRHAGSGNEIAKRPELFHPPICEVTSGNLGQPRSQGPISSSLEKVPWFRLRLVRCLSTQIKSAQKVGFFT